MKRNQMFIAGVAGSIFVALVLCAGVALGAGRGSAKLIIGGAHIAIDDGRPALQGRDMLKQLQPGQLWRIGANAPTTLETDKALDFGGTIVPKGKHILLARLDEPGKWTLVFSTKSVFDYDPSAKVAEVPLTFREVGDSLELVDIQLKNENDTGWLEIGWGKMRLSTSFKVF